MALKAGYVGVKRWIYEKLGKDVSALKVDSFPYSVAGVMGSRNLLKNTATSGTTHVVVFTVNADGSISLSGTADANATKNLNSFTGAEVKAMGAELKLTGGLSSNIYLAFRSADWSFNLKDLGEGLTFETADLVDATTYYVSLVVASGTNTNNKVIYPMLKVSDDTSSIWAPYAMTNQQLTAEAATLETVDTEHKTAINAIISAATGAADFAAFKTAMGAITPLTRSAAPDARTLEEVEEPAPVTKTTRTKKTVKEEE